MFAVTAPLRACLDCGADITDRAKQARRCKPCADGRNEASRHAPPRPRSGRACCDCGADLLGRGPQAKRCVRCADVEIERSKRVQYANSEQRPYNCQFCGDLFLRRRTDTLFCREKCWKAARAAAHRAERATRFFVCGWCGKDFRPVRSDASYCQPKCTRAASYAADPAKRKAQAAAWVAANPDRRQAIARADKARRKAAPGPGVRSADWRRLLRHYRNHCAYCGGGGVIHMEHVIPLSRGGRHAIGNVLPACAGCNLSKNNDLLVEWRRRLRRTSAIPRQRTAEALTLL